MRSSAQLPGQGRDPRRREAVEDGLVHLPLPWLLGSLLTIMALSLASLACLLAWPAPAARADEGMWLFSNLPRQQLNQVTALVVLSLDRVA